MVAYIDDVLPCPFAANLFERLPRAQQQLVELRRIRCISLATLRHVADAEIETPDVFGEAADGKWGEVLHVKMKPR